VAVDNGEVPQDDSRAGPTGRARRETRRPSIFWVLAALVLPIWNLSVKYRFHGSLPAQGAFVLAPNHFTEIDPLIMGAATFKLGRLPRFLAKASLFRIPVVGWLLRTSGQIPVERAGGTGHSALRAAEELVDKGRMVIVYPEGSLTRDPDLWPMRGKTGAVRIALERNIPVIPAAHWGSQAVMARYGKRVRLLTRRPVDVSIGEAVDLGRWRDRPLDNATLTEATAKVMEEIALLLAELRGVPAPAERWDPAKNRQSETGRFDG
jgi:1-acyl-sn-glycerol-3-phosphate acyltransferase